MRFPVRRVFCIGKNYADHVAEMGGAAKAERGDAPTVFTKSARCLVPGGTMPYPANTDDLHWETELVVAIGADGEVWGHAVGLDMTRRDLQAEAKRTGGTWDRAKSFPASAPMGSLREGSVEADAELSLRVNGEVRQRSSLSHMMWGVGEIVAFLRADMGLDTGDLVFTGTPAGVGACVPGDVLEAEVDGLPGLRVAVVER